MKKLICALMICLVGGMAIGAEATFMKAPELPAEVLFVAEWSNLETLQGNAQGFANAIKPGTPLPPIAIALSQLTKLADPMVLETALPQRVILVKDAAGEVNHVSVLQVTDAQAFMDSLLPTLHDNGSSNGIHLFVEKKQIFDRKAFMKASQQERQNIQMFMQSVENPVVVGTKDKFAFVGRTESAVKTAMGVVSAGALSKTPALGQGDLAMFANVKGIMAASIGGPDGPFDALREKMKSAMPFGQMGAEGAKAEAVLSAEVDACEELMAQIATMQASLSLGADQMTLKFGMDAVSGTELAAYLASIPQGMPDTLKYLPQDAIFVVAARLGDMMPLADTMAAFQTELMAAQGMGDSETVDMASITKDALQAYGDDFSFAMRSGKGIQMVEVIRLKDKAAAQTLIAKMANMAEMVNAMYQGMGMGLAMDFTPAAHTYKDQEISEWAISFDGTVPESADPQMAAMQAQQTAAMKAMFGDALLIDAAILDNDWVLTIGDDALKSLKVVMDGTYAKLADEPAFKKAMRGIPTDSEGVLYLHLTDMIQWGMSLGQQMGAPMPPNVANAQFERGPGIVAAFNVSGAQTVCDVHLPTAEIKTLLDGFMGMKSPAQQRVRMTPKGPGANRTPPPPASNGGPGK